MIKKTFEKVNESIFYEKLNNGLEVYLYKTDKTKNFYITMDCAFDWGALDILMRSSGLTYDSGGTVEYLVCH